MNRHAACTDALVICAFSFRILEVVQ